MVSIPDENDRSLKITKKFFQVGHLYAVREQREEFFILSTKHWIAVVGIKNRRERLHCRCLYKQVDVARLKGFAREL